MLQDSDPRYIYRSVPKALVGPFEADLRKRGIRAEYQDFSSGDRVYRIPREALGPVPQKGVFDDAATASPPPASLDDALPWNSL